MIKRESQEIHESTTCEVGHTNLCPVTKKCFMDWFRREHNYNISMPQQQQKNKKKKYTSSVNIRACKLCLKSVLHINKKKNELKERH